MGFKALERRGTCSIGKVKAEVVASFLENLELIAYWRWGISGVFASLEGWCTLYNLQNWKGRIIAALER
jgi:hypothetical protein